MNSVTESVPIPAGAREADLTDVTAPVSRPARARIRTLQVGSGWFAERAGGLDRYYVDLLNALPAAGVDVNGLVLGTDRVKTDSDGAVHAYARPDAPMLRRCWAARRAVRQTVESTSPDLLVTHFAPYALPLIGASGLPTVVHFHGPWAAESVAEGGGRQSSQIKSFVEGLVYKRATRIIVLSRAFRDLLITDYHVDPCRIEVVPGGVSARFYDAAAISRADARVQLGWPQDRPIVLAVRRLANRMGLDRLIDAMSRVRARVPDALCLIAGRGRLEAKLNKQIQSASLQYSVRLIGFVPDAHLPIAYRAADVSAIPSEALEGFGLSAVESLAAGTPAIVTRVGGLPEVVEGLSAALVVRPDCPHALADAIATAINSPSTLPASARCTAYARAEYDWYRVAQRIATIYRHAIK